jgi:hypothetical protein
MTRLKSFLDSFENDRGAYLAILILAVFLPVLGLIGIVVYTKGGSQLGAGLLAAASATAVGLLFGLLFGVPRYVSSGQARFAAKKPSQDTKSGGAAKPNSSDGAAANNAFAPSTNLAEVSDWLTKLLLGAGLVSLTKLGAPLARLVDSVGAGLSPSGVATESSKVVGASIIFGFTALGFLYGYMVTTTWYNNELKKDWNAEADSPEENGEGPQPDPSSGSSSASDTSASTTHIHVDTQP